MKKIFLTIFFLTICLNVNAVVTVDSNQLTTKHVIDANNTILSFFDSLLPLISAPSCSAANGCGVKIQDWNGRRWDTIPPTTDMFADLNCMDATGSLVDNFGCQRNGDEVFQEGAGILRSTVAGVARGSRLLRACFWTNYGAVGNANPDSCMYDNPNQGTGDKNFSLHFYQNAFCVPPELGNFYLQNKTCVYSPPVTSFFQADMNVRVDANFFVLDSNVYFNKSVVDYNFRKGDGFNHFTRLDDGSKMYDYNNNPGLTKFGVSKN